MIRYVRMVFLKVEHHLFFVESSIFVIAEIIGDRRIYDKGNRSKLKESPKDFQSFSKQSFSVENTKKMKNSDIEKVFSKYRFLKLRSFITCFLINGCLLK